MKADILFQPDYRAMSAVIGASAERSLGSPRGLLGAADGVVDVPG